MKYVIVGFIFKKDKLLLVKHKDMNMWLPVGGHAEKGEDFHQTLKREVMEETNLEIIINKEPFYVMKEPKERTPHYVCKYKSGRIKLKKDELSDYAWFSLSQIKNSDLHPQIKKLSLEAFNLKK